MAHVLAQRTHGRGELLADGLVHGIGLVAALFGGGFVLARALSGAAGEAAVFGLYVLALVTMLGISAAYNLMPVSPLK
ncbi:MAG: hypothetical protein LCH46_13355 [Proteobacteria bacterium]|nr:hypothetical protein [Pseudomonadota bacterium]